MKEKKEELCTTPAPLLNQTPPPTALPIETTKILPKQSTTLIPLNPVVWAMSHSLASREYCAP
eukprot:662530-Ditylum_brightwellii.AAC.1